MRYRLYATPFATQPMMEINNAVDYPSRAGLEEQDRVAF